MIVLNFATAQREPSLRRAGANARQGRQATVEPSARPRHRQRTCRRAARQLGGLIEPPKPQKGLKLKNVSLHGRGGRLAKMVPSLGSNLQFLKIYRSQEGVRDYHCSSFCLYFFIDGGGGGQIRSFVTRSLSWELFSNPIFKSSS